MENHRRIHKVNRKIQAEKYKKFIGSQKEGQGFADKRKKKVQYEYLKMLRKEKRQHVKVPSSHVSEASSDSDVKKKGRDKDADSNTYSKSQKQYSKKKVEKEKKKKEVLQKKKEMSSALDNYKNKKSKQYKLMCKKTYKGQPVMKNQIEILLHKIQSGINQT